MGCRRALPRKPLGMFQAPRTQFVRERGLVHDPTDCCDEPADIMWVDRDRRVTDDLGQ
jgi:hypothetical protein